MQKRSSRSIPGLWGVIVLLSLAPLVAQSSNDMAGVALFESGQFTAAQQFFEAFVSRYPTDPSGAYYLGRIAFNGKQYAQAVTWFAKAVQLESKNADYHLWLGRAYGQQARCTNGGGAFFLARKVKTHLEKAVELNPDSIEARSDLLKYYLQAPIFLGEGSAKAKEQAEEIAKRNAAEGRKARQRCEQVDVETLGKQTVPPRHEAAGTDR